MSLLHYPSSVLPRTLPRNNDLRVLKMYAHGSMIPRSALTLHSTLAVLAAAAVRRAAQDANTNAERVGREAVLAVLLARDIACAVAALFEERRVLGGGSNCWGAQGLAGQGSKEKGGDAGGGELHLDNGWQAGKRQ